MLIASRFWTRAEAAGVTRFFEVGYDSREQRARRRARPGGLPRSAPPWGYTRTMPRGSPIRTAAPHPTPTLCWPGSPRWRSARGWWRSARSASISTAISPPGRRRSAAFRAQLALAKRLGLPVILHVRDAYPEALALLEAEGLPERRGVLHAFAGDASTAAWARRHGFRLGIGGPVTYRSSALPDLLRGVPPDELLLETDAPWLPPHPQRGRRNEPAWLCLTAAAVAQVCGLSLEVLAERTTAACAALFGAVD